MRMIKDVVVKAVSESQIFCRKLLQTEKE